MQREIYGVIHDLDDNLTPWEAPHAKAYPQMSAALSRVTGIPHKQIIDEIRQVNTRHRTIEYTALIQEMPSFCNLPEAKQRKLIKIAQRNRAEAMKDIFTPFPDVQILLEVLQTNDLINIILSDAPVNLAYLRAQRSKLLDYLDLIIGTKSPDDSKFFPENRMANKAYQIPIKVSEEKKPMTDLARLLDIYSDEELRKKYILIGNSSFSDQGLARRLGLLYYQTNWSNATEEDRKDLLPYAPASVLAANVGTRAEDNGDTKIDTHHNFEMVNVNSPMEILIDMHRRGIISKLRT